MSNLSISSNPTPFLETNTSNQELLKSQKELAVVADKFERLKNLGRRQRDDIKERDAKIASLQAEKEELIKKAEESTAELGAATGLQSGAGSSVETQIKLNMLTKKIKALEEEKQQLKTKLVMLEKSNAVLSEYSITFKIDENLLKEYPLTLAHDDNTALPQFIKKNERMQNLIHKLKIVRKTLGAAEQRNAELSLKIEQLEKKMVQLKNKESDTVASMTSVPESVKPVIGVAPNNARNIAEENVENVGEREVKDLGVLLQAGIKVFGSKFLKDFDRGKISFSRADGLSTGAKRPRDITPNSKQPADKRRRELDDKPTATVAPVVQVKEPT